MEQCRTAFKSDQKFTASRGARPCDLAPYTWCIFLFGLMTIALFWDTLHTLKKKKNWRPEGGDKPGRGITE